MSVSELKEKGADAWKKGDFEQAVEWFGKAIDADGGENRSGQLKELLSNRSAARLKARDGEDADGAVADAERCVVLDGAWESVLRFLEPLARLNPSRRRGNAWEDNGGSARPQAPMAAARFLVNRQRYLELLEASEQSAATVSA